MVTALAIAEKVTDPELPMITLADLGVLREVSEVDGRVIVAITPTYTGCPARRPRTRPALRRVPGNRSPDGPATGLEHGLDQ